MSYAALTLCQLHESYRLACMTQSDNFTPFQVGYFILASSSILLLALIARLRDLVDATKQLSTARQSQLSGHEPAEPAPPVNRVASSSDETDGAR